MSNAFAKVLAVLQRGGGPDVAFRAYLLTAVRRLHVDQIRAGGKLQTTDDIAAFDPGEPFRDTAVEGFENAAAAKAFASLPERWQLVLWHTEVEGNKPADIAPLMGMSANSVAALAYRAREGAGQQLSHDAIYDANSFMLAAAIRRAGAIAYRVGIVSDDPTEFADALSDGLRSRRPRGDQRRGEQGGVRRRQGRPRRSRHRVVRRGADAAGQAARIRLRR